MSEELSISESVRRAAASLQTSYFHDGESEEELSFLLPNGRSIRHVLDALIIVLFPSYRGHEPDEEDDEDAEARLAEIADGLCEQVERAFYYQARVDASIADEDVPDRALACVTRLVDALPEIQGILRKDLQAAYDGDPAAKSVTEIVVSYPGFEAVITHRIAHHLYKEGVELIPRMMAEQAHSHTGIDIHPGATIGEGFFIDHGTGVVIGETTMIGRNVKIYQGVTLGALSFRLDDAGCPIKGIKRHPNVEDGATIYAGATILGGDTTIGADSEVGGNVWLTQSVPPNSKVYNQQPRPAIVPQSTA